MRIVMLAFNACQCSLMAHPLATIRHSSDTMRFSCRMDRIVYDQPLQCTGYLPIWTHATEARMDHAWSTHSAGPADSYTLP